MKTGHIFIAGASSDIGFEISQSLDKKGESLVLHSSSEQGLRKLKQFFASSDRHVFLQLDFNNLEGFNEVLTPLLKNHPLKGLVNCVGIRSRRPLKLLKPDHVQKVFQVNFFGFLELLRFATLRGNFVSGFSVVQISSISAQSGGASVTAYAASKAAGDVAVRSLAKELFPKGIRLNSVRCGQVNTTAYDELQNGKAYDPVLQRQYTGLLETRDVAEIVLFLLSEKSNKTTGQFFDLDGGYLQ